MSNYNSEKIINLTKKRGIILKITHFRVEKLHDIYDYNVSFNSDVTFLYGSNGCGKTTILNLITFTITGYIYKLFDYTFKMLELVYKDNDICKKIIIEKCDENSLKVNYNEKNYVIKRRDFHGELFLDNEGRLVNEFPENFYFKHHTWLKEIKTSFNFVFLPLSRNNSILGHMYDKKINNERFLLSHEFDSKKINTLEASLNYVKGMVNETYTQISSKINEINEDFRNKMFMSFFHFNQDNKYYSEVFSTLNQNKNFDRSKDKLLKTFNDIGILSQEFIKEIDTFYDKWQIALDNYRKSASKKNNEDLSSHLSIIISNYARIQQILEITNLADEMDIQKEKTLNPINTFLELINGFFKQSECSKEIKIDKKGKIFFIIPNCSTPLEIENLSSGEQQLLIFFAYLIFGLREYNQGIFIVDEPELSLHLAWQRKYVESILNINSNVQLIFATHSPEIVGKFRDKKVRLIQKIDGCHLVGEQ